MGLSVRSKPFLWAASHAVLPYSQYLHEFPAYLQHDESAAVNTLGWQCYCLTQARFSGGEAGTVKFNLPAYSRNSIIPADFIAFVNTRCRKDADLRHHDSSSPIFFLPD